MPRASKPMAASVKREVAGLRDPRRARFLQRFFRTGPGEYAEGDRLLGLTVLDQRQIAQAFRQLSLGQCEKLLQSPFHEHRERASPSIELDCWKPPCTPNIIKTYYRSSLDGPF